MIGFGSAPARASDPGPFAVRPGVSASPIVGAVAGAENLRRQMRRLRSNPHALSALLRLGVGEPLIDRFSLGFKEPYAARGSGLVTENALAFPIHARGGGPIGRFAYFNLSGLTLNPGRPDYWGPGDCLPYYSRAAEEGDDLLVVRDPLTMWLAAGALDSSDGGRVVVLTRSHFDGLPFDFSGSGFWRPWRRVVLALDEDDQSAAMADAILRGAGREVLRATSGAEGGWAQALAQGASGHTLRMAMDRAKVAASPAALRASRADAEVGSFEADPVAVVGAFVNGYMYYATRIERRHAAITQAVPGRSPPGDHMVQEYATLVLMRRIRRVPVAADAETPEQAKLLARAARYMDPADQGAPLAERLEKAERILASRVRQPSLFGARMLAVKAKRPVPIPGPEAPFWGESELVRAYRCSPVSLVGNRGGRGNWSPASADLHLRLWSMAMGRFHLPTEDGGAGVAIEDLSVILFANPYSYLNQEVGRVRELAAAGAGTRADRPILTSRTVSALIGLAALFKEGTGWIARNPDLLRRMVVVAAPLAHIASDPRFEMARADEAARVAMPQSLLDRFRADWTGACREAERIYRQLASDVARLVETGRDPFEPIGVLAALDVPMAGFYRLMYQSEKRWPDVEVNPYHHHLAVRMSVLVRIASLLFLRSKNLRKMTWVEDQTGQLRYVDGFWEVVISWREFKNSRNNDLFGPYASRQDYRRRRPDQHGLYELLRYYTSTSLPALRARFPGSPYLFPTRMSPFPGPQAMTKRFNEWTREHCVHDAGRGTGMPGLMLFGLHALRDLGATTLLKDTSNPNRLQEAADLLQTSVEQVRYRYAKLGIVERLARADPLLSTASDLALGGTPLWADAS